MRLLRVSRQGAAGGAAARRRFLTGILPQLPAAAARTTKWGTGTCPAQRRSPHAQAGAAWTLLCGKPWVLGSALGQWMSSTVPNIVDVSSGERQAVNISERCAKRIRKVQPDGFLRLRVDGGGCSGFQYKFELDSASQDDDVMFEKAGAKLVIDETSLDLVRGSTIDFVEEMISSSFQVVNNPNSESSCGCGSSFAPKM